MEDLEEVLTELTRFESGRQREIPRVLEDFLKHVARTGDSVFPWPKVRPLLKRKLDIIADEFCQQSPPEKIPAMPNVDPFRYDQIREEIHSRIDSLTGTPFTIQRLCELITEPQRYYKRTDKFMRGVEKNVLVVTTIEATRRRRPAADAVNGAAGSPEQNLASAGGTETNGPSHSETPDTGCGSWDSGAASTHTAESGAELSAVSGSEAPSDARPEAPAEPAAELQPEAVAELQSKAAPETETEAEPAEKPTAVNLSISVPANGDAAQPVQTSGDAVTMATDGDAVTVASTGDADAMLTSDESDAVGTTDETVSMATGDAVPMKTVDDAVHDAMTGNALTVTKTGESVSMPTSDDSPAMTSAENSLTMTDSADTGMASAEDALTTTNAADTVMSSAEDAVTMATAEDAVPMAPAEDAEPLPPAEETGSGTGMPTVADSTEKSAADQAGDAAGACGEASDVSQEVPPSELSQTSPPPAGTAADSSDASLDSSSMSLDDSLCGDGDPGESPVA